MGYRRPWPMGPSRWRPILRAARSVGANTFHLKFRSRTLEEYLDQLDAFAEAVVPLVDEP